MERGKWNTGNETRNTHRGTRNAVNRNRITDSKNGKNNKNKSNGVVCLNECLFVLISMSVILKWAVVVNWV